MIVALQSLEISDLSDRHKRFYESSKLKNWKCKLCMLLQIKSHLSKSCSIITYDQTEQFFHLNQGLYTIIFLLMNN